METISWVVRSPLLFTCVALIAANCARGRPPIPAAADATVAHAVRDSAIADDTGGAPMFDESALAPKCRDFYRAYLAAEQAGGNCKTSEDCDCYSKMGGLSGGNRASDVKTARQLNDIHQRYLDNDCPEICTQGTFVKCFAKCLNGVCVVDEARMNREWERRRASHRDRVPNTTKKRH